ncbi:hypothetical protein EMCRGX_G016767 [Ephydatia muelleri]|eukprot:Em0008g574a
MSDSTGKVSVALVTKPFQTWQKKSAQFANHEKTSYHQCSLQLAEQLVHSVQHPETNLLALFSSRRADNIARNRGILKSVASAVLFCAKQCIALRGDADTPRNPGNFLALLKLLATQNELIEEMEKYIVLCNIVDVLKAARWYVILADEVTSHNIEHLAICARFVDQNNGIRKEFLTFIGLDRITCAEIADAIIKFLQDNDVPVQGQGYDSASNTSSDRVGVQARIQQAAPLATYVHCSGHFQNEVELIVTENVPDSPEKKPLLGLCRTCWAERHSAYQHFYQAYTVKLQKRSLDIMDVHELIAEQYVQIAESVSTTPEMPRVTGRQQHCSNPSSFSVEDYFKKTVATPLLDHIITSMKDRFTAAVIVASSLLGVIPSVCCSREVNMERAIESTKMTCPALS